MTTEWTVRCPACQAPMQHVAQRFVSAGMYFRCAACNDTFAVPRSSPASTPESIWRQPDEARSTLSRPL